MFQLESVFEAAKGTECKFLVLVCKFQFLIYAPAHQDISPLLPNQPNRRHIGMTQGKAQV